jgi:hypothetical protein
MSDYKDDAARKQQNNIKEARESNATGSNNNAVKNSSGLETNGPQKKQTKVLNEDGSLADLPDQDVEGAGVGDGTVGAH